VLTEVWSQESFAAELEVASRLARAAGRMAAQIRSGGLPVQLRDGQPTTLADRLSAELIATGLARAFPSDAIVAEDGVEDGVAPRDPASPARRTWYVDPIDGTWEYCFGRPGYSVMIGLVAGDRPVVGAVYQPAADRLFAAAPGRASVAIGGGRGWPIAVSRRALGPGLRLVSSPRTRPGLADQVARALGISDQLVIGSVGVKVGLIAAGERDLYVSPSARCRGWDVCAADAILRAAGGMLTDLAGHPLRYAPDAPPFGGLLATNGLLHAPLARVIADLRTVPAGG
jgi:3'(2'), 5'-bisphosphate nucleotidase